MDHCIALYRPRCVGWAITLFRPAYLGSFHTLELEQGKANWIHTTYNKM
jgi:hypothetical protein